MRPPPLRRHPKLTWRGRPSWPPPWGGAVGPGTKLPIGEQGVLKAVEKTSAFPALPAHLTLVIEYEGNGFRGLLLADDAALLEALYPTLHACLDWPVLEIGSLELDL